MKFNVQEQKNIEISSTGTTTDFKIKCDATAFRAVIENLYSDVPYAVVREICTNAIDACLAAGKEPNDFVIHTPSHNEPTFIVEDNGIGMSKDEVVSVYSTLFESTKSDTNDYTGMYGLGSKAPLAYTNSFFVETRKDGIESTFVVTWDKSQNQSPQISWFQNMDKPTEKTGTKITINIKEEDIDAFNESIARACVSFPALPKFENTTNFYYGKVLDELNKGFKKSCFLVSGNNIDLFNTHGDWVEMGNVMYPFVKPPVYLKYQFFPILYDTLRKNDTPVIKDGKYDIHVMHMKLGSVEIAPDREKLVYNDYTNRNILYFVVSNYIDQIHCDGNLRERFRKYHNSYRLFEDEVLGYLKMALDTLNDEVLNRKFNDAMESFTKDLEWLKNNFGKFDIQDSDSYVVFSKLVNMKNLSAAKLDGKVFEDLDVDNLFVIPLSKEDVSKHCKITSTSKIWGKSLANSIMSMKTDNTGFLFGTEVALKPIVDNMLYSKKLENFVVDQEKISLNDYTKFLYVCITQNKKSSDYMSPCSIRNIENIFNEEQIDTIIPCFKKGGNYYIVRKEFFSQKSDELFEVRIWDNTRLQTMFPDNACLIFAHKKEMITLMDYFKDRVKIGDISDILKDKAEKELENLINCKPSANNIFSSFSGEYKDTKIDIEKIIGKYDWSLDSDFYSAYLMSKDLSMDYYASFEGIYSEYMQRSYVITVYDFLDKDFHNRLAEVYNEKTQINRNIAKRINKYPLLKDLRHLETSLLNIKLYKYSDININEKETLFENIVDYAYAMDVAKRGRHD